MQVDDAEEFGICRPGFLGNGQVLRGLINLACIIFNHPQEMHLTWLTSVDNVILSLLARCDEM